MLPSRIGVITAGSVGGVCCGCVTGPAGESAVAAGSGLTLCPQMDHHCIWLNNCVGYANHKPFLLFLLYTTLLALWVAATSAQVVVWFFRDPDAADEVVNFTPVAWLMLVMMGCVFGLSIGGFAVYHVFLVGWVRRGGGRGFALIVPRRSTAPIRPRSRL